LEDLLAGFVRRFHGHGRLFSDFNQPVIIPYLLESGESVSSILGISLSLLAASGFTLFTASIKKYRC
jgi:hypothetical protein